MPIGIKTFRINHDIRANELRVIDEQGENLGLMSKSQALSTALDKGLDLVEINPEAQPPVAKIISYDKFRYQQDKEAKKQHRPASDQLKQIRLSARAADNDLRVKVKKIEEFLEKGHKVEIMLRLRGREKVNKEWARERFTHFIQMIEKEYKVIAPEKFMGNGITMQIAKK